MMLFSIGNQEEKAFEIAKKLAEEIPNSDWAHVSLFKFYLDKNENENAITSMFKVLQNKKIDDRIKHRILNEFLIVTINTNNYDKELEKAVSYFDDDKNINISKEMGKFFYNKKDFIKLSNWMLNQFKIRGIDILDIFYCPHNSDSDCKCRKPKPGMFLQAQEKYNINMKKSSKYYQLLIKIKLLIILKKLKYLSLI